MKDLLLEIGTEEMPANIMPSLVSQFKTLAEQKLAEARLSFENIKIGIQSNNINIEFIIKSSLAKLSAFLISFAPKDWPIKVVPDEAKPYAGRYIMLSH